MTRLDDLGPTDAGPMEGALPGVEEDWGAAPRPLPSPYPRGEFDPAGDHAAFEDGFDDDAGGTNVGQSERIASVAAGALLATLGLSRRTGPGWLIAAVGGGLLYRGLSGHCPAYGAMGVNTADEGDAFAEEDFRGPSGNVAGRWGGGAMGVSPRQREKVGRRIERRGVHIEQALQVNKSPEELYAFWRDFTNLPRIMRYLEAVRVDGTDPKRSHWVAKAPKLAGGLVEWDAETIADEPNRRIAWQSLPGSDIDTSGEVRFEPMMGDRGTAVHVTMKYVPPAGRVGHWLTSMMGENPERAIREDLRNFKRTMEIGEVLTIEGQPAGTCTGEGKRYHESEAKPHFK